MCRVTYVPILILVFVFVEADKIIVTVKQGKLKGQREATVFDGKLYFAFYGVPYAQPPIGNLRFKNPRPVQKWNNIFDASLEYHGSCAQTHIVHKYGLYGSEDCLYLNIYTPNLPKPEETNFKSVIVWIHGYAFTSCLSHIHGPDFFVNNDIILVTLTHRIGAFGFLKHKSNDSHANMGLKDIVIALKWIKVNIKQFGGNANKLTLMGSGSGATFISLLMTTKASKLFSQVMLQSGVMFSPAIFQTDPVSERNRLEQELNRKHLTLKGASTNEIVQAAHNIYIRNTNDMINLQRPVVPFTPIIESKSNKSLLLHTPEQFYAIMKKEHRYFNKPILIGYNTQESISEAIPFLHNPYYLKKFIQFFKFVVPFSDGCKYNSSSETYQEVSRLIKYKYFNEGDAQISLDSLLRYASDLIKYPIIKFIKAHLDISNSHMYMYKFDYRGTLNAVKATSIAGKNIKINGVASGDEICYLFRCEPFWEAYAKIKKEENNKDIKFINDISLLWSNFVKFGDPTPLNFTGNTTWLPVNSKLDNVLLIRKNFKMINSKQDDAMFDFWKLLYETYYKEDVCYRKRDEL